MENADRAVLSGVAVAPATVLALPGVDFLEAGADMLNFSDYRRHFEMVGLGRRIEYLNAGKSSGPFAGRVCSVHYLHVFCRVGAPGIGCLGLSGP